MTDCGFSIYVCHQVTIGHAIRLKHKLYVITKAILFFHKTFRFLFTMSPYKEYIIYTPKLNKWLQFLRFKNIYLKLTHKNAHIRWCKFCANSGSKNLMEYFLPKLKVVINENKFCHLYEPIQLVSFYFAYNQEHL